MLSSSLDRSILFQVTNLATLILALSDEEEKKNQMFYQTHFY